MDRIMDAGNKRNHAGGEQVHETIKKNNEWAWEFWSAGFATKKIFSHSVKFLGPRKSLIFVETGKGF